MHTEPTLGRRSRCAGFYLLAMGALGPASWGAIWQSQDWALTGKLSGATGYDSNLTLARNGPGDMFMQVRPELSFLRRNSGTLQMLARLATLAIIAFAG